MQDVNAMLMESLQGDSQEKVETETGAAKKKRQPTPRQLAALEKARKARWANKQQAETAESKPATAPTDSTPEVLDIIERGDLRMAPDAPKMIYQLLPAVTAEIGAIRKEQRNSHQKYRYRGIDDALNQISPVLCKHGICTEVEVDDHTISTNDTGNKTIRHATVSLQVTFFAPDGSSIVSRAVGEGISHGDDKATAKAMSGAMKYALFFGLMVPVDRDELADPDSVASEPESEIVVTAKQLIEQATTKKRIGELVDRVKNSDAFTDEQKSILTFQAETRAAELPARKRKGKPTEKETEKTGETETETETE